MKKIISAIILCAMLCCMTFTLASCGGPSSDPDKALAALQDAGLVAAKDSTVLPTTLSLVGIKDVECVVSGTGKIDGEAETVTIFYFEDSKAANAAWEKAQEYAGDKKTDEETDWVCKKSGAMIYYGTKAAVKAAK